MATLRIREQHKEIAIKIAVAAVLCVLFFHFFIKPVFSESVYLRQQIRDSGARLELFRDVRQLRDELSVAEQPFSALTARSSLVGRISDMANKNRIDVQSLTPKTIPEGEYVKLRIEVSGQSSYFALLKFLKELESFEPPLNIGGVFLSRQSYAGAGGETEELLQLRLYLETYLLKKARGRAKA